MINSTYGNLWKGTERVFIKDSNVEQWLKLDAVEIIVDVPVTYVPSQPLVKTVPDEVEEFEKIAKETYPKVITPPKPSAPNKGVKK